MSNDFDHTTFPPPAPIPETPGAGAVQQRPRPRPGNSAEAPAGPTKLRRWSVAALIARAVPRSPADAVAH